MYPFLFFTFLFGFGVIDAHSLRECGEARGSEAYFLPDGLDYRGNVSVTLSGIPCQPWTSQSPHQHNTIIDVSRGLGDHSFCRNAFGSVTAGCFTTDSRIRFELCDIGLPCAGDVDGQASHESSFLRIEPSTEIRVGEDDPVSVVAREPYVGLAGQIEVTLWCSSRWHCNITCRLSALSAMIREEVDVRERVAAGVWREYTVPFSLDHPGRFLLECEAVRQSTDGVEFVRTFRSQQYVVLAPDETKPIEFYPDPKAIFPAAVLVSVMSALPHSRVQYTISPPGSGDRHASDHGSSVITYAGPFWLYSSALVTAEAVDVRTGVTLDAPAVEFNVSPSGLVEGVLQMFPAGGNFTGGVDVLLLAPTFSKLLVQENGGPWRELPSPVIRLRAAMDPHEGGEVRRVAIRSQAQSGAMRTSYVEGNFVIAPLAPAVCSPSSSTLLAAATILRCATPLAFEIEEMNRGALPGLRAQVNGSPLDQFAPEIENDNFGRSTLVFQVPLCCQPGLFQVVIEVSSPSLSGLSVTTSMNYTIARKPLLPPALVGVIPDEEVPLVVITPARVMLALPPLAALELVDIFVGEEAVPRAHFTVEQDTSSSLPVAFLAVSPTLPHVFRRVSMDVLIRSVPQVNVSGSGAPLSPFDLPSATRNITLVVEDAGSQTTYFGFVAPAIATTTASMETEALASFAVALNFAPELIRECLALNASYPVTVVAVSCLTDATISPLASRLLSANTMPGLFRVWNASVRLLWSESAAHFGTRLQAISSMTAPGPLLPVAAPIPIALFGPNHDELRGRCKAVPRGLSCKTFAEEHELEAGGKCVVQLPVSGSFTLCVNTGLGYAALQPAPDGFPIVASDPAERLYSLHPVPGIRYTASWDDAQQSISLVCDGCHALRLNGTTVVPGVFTADGRLSVRASIPVGRTLVSVVSRNRLGVESILRTAIYQVLRGPDPATSLDFEYGFRSVDGHVVSLTIMCSGAMCNADHVRSVSLSLEADCGGGGVHSAYLEASTSPTQLLSTPISVVLSGEQAPGQRVSVCVNEAIAAQPQRGTLPLSLISTGLGQCVQANALAQAGNCTIASCAIVRGAAHCICSGSSSNGTASDSSAEMRLCDAGESTNIEPDVNDRFAGVPPQQKSVLVVFVLLMISIVALLTWVTIVRMRPSEPESSA